MKQMVFSKVLIVVACTLMLCALVPTPAVADQAQYIYDDLGRLVQVVDGQGNVATYNYDAVGNLLSITRSTGGVGAPTVTGITPNSGAAGATVTVSLAGTNLTGAALATNNSGILVRNVLTTPTSITATFQIAFSAPPGAATVTVTTTTGSATTSFTVNASPPAITTLTPNTGPPTRLVTITGTGFSATAASNQISFNGVSATTLRATPTQLLAQVPAGAATGPVTVTTNSLTSNGVAFTVTTPAGPPPTVTLLSPIVGTSSGGTKVTFTGTNFVAGTTALFGTGAGLLPTTLSPTQLTAIAPFSRTPGLVDVVVTNANGDAFLPAAFTYVAGPNQSISAITPTPGLINIPRNVPVTVSFARPVDRATITTASFALTQGATPVAGTFTFEFNDTVVTFTPSATLAASTVYTLALTQAIKSVDGIPIDGAFLGTFSTGTGSDTVSPSVTVSPLNGAVGVPYNSTIFLSFSEPINPNSVNATTIQVTNNGLRNGTLTFGGQNTVVIFTPLSPFSPGTTVSVLVSGLVRDVAGNRLVGGGGVGTDVVTTFTTGATADLAPPQVLQTNPLNGATGINPNSSIAVAFNESVNPLTVTASTFVVSAGGPPLTGQLLFSNFNQVVTFIPAVPFPGLSPVMLTLNPGIADVAGNFTIAPFTSTFLTAQAIDNFQPSVIATSPAAGIGNLPLNTKVTLVFDERINPGTITSANLPISGPSGVITGSYSVAANQLSATFTPAAPLLTFTGYTVQYTTGIRDLAGNALFNPGSFSIGTGSLASDQTSGQVVAISPRNAATGIATNAPILVVFTEPVSATSLNSQTFIVSTGGIPVQGTIAFDPGQNSQVARWKPAIFTTLQPNTFYQVQITSGVRDAAGNALVPFTSGFTTGAGADTVAPTATVANVTPVNGATNVPQTTAVTVLVSEAVNAITVNGESVRLVGNGISGTVFASLGLSADRRTLTVTPTAPLLANTGYFIQLWGTNGNYGLEDLAGNRFTPNGFTSSFTTGFAAGTNFAVLPLQATVTPNPTTLFADGVTTSTVTISNINRSGTLVANGTVVAVTAQSVYASSAGGTILGGTPSPDGRFRLFTTVGGAVTLTYQSPMLNLFGGNGIGVIQVAQADAAGSPLLLLGQATMNLLRSTGLTPSANPTSLLANGASTSEITVQVTDNQGVPVQAGVPIGVTAQPVYTSSAGGTINGGTVPQDTRFKVFTTITGGRFTFTYTAPTLAAGQSASANLQFVEMDVTGVVILRQIGSTQFLNLNGSSGFTGPQPTVVALTPVNGQGGVGTNVPVTALFSQPLNPATVTASTFSVTTGGVPIAGTRALSAGERGPNTVVTFTPTAPWTASTAITVSITTGVQSAVGSALLAAQSAVFSTGTGADGTAPTVVAVNPAAGATGIFTNQVFTVQFNETLNPATVTAASVALTAGGTPVAVQRILTGTNNSAVVLVPDALLSPNTTYTFTATTTVTDQAGNALAAPFTSTFTTTTTADNFRPSVINVSPATGVSNLPLNTRVSIVFSERINPGTVNSTSFQIFGGPIGQVSGSYAVAADLLSATFTPSVPLLTFTGYSVSYNTNIRDLAGNSLNAGSFSFSTGSLISDGTSPQVLFISPGTGTTGSAINAPLILYFSEPVGPSTVTDQTMVVSTGGVPVPGSFTFDPGQNNQVLRWKPAGCCPPVQLTPNTTYAVSLTAGVRDAAGNALVPFTSGFTTGAGADTVAPTATVANVTPVNGATNVPQTTAVTVLVSEAVNAITVNGESVRLVGNGISGTVFASLGLSADRRTLTVTPTAPLLANTGYFIQLWGTNGNYGLEDLAGNRFTPNGFTSSFTTGFAAGTNFAVLPLQATVTPNPTTLFADGVTTSTVTISNINRSGTLVANGTVVAVTAQSVYASSAGGTILGGTPSPDGRFRLFTTVGGAVTLTYQSPMLNLFGGNGIGVIQVAQADAAGSPLLLLGQATMNLLRSTGLTPSANPTSLLANGASTSEITVQVTDNQGVPVQAGVPIGVTAQPVYTSSAGGTINGGTVPQDTRFKVFTTITGGRFTFTYTAPTLAAGQSASANLQFVEMDVTGVVILRQIGSTQFLNLNGSSGFTGPQPTVVALTPVNGQGGVGTNVPVTALFSQPLNPATVTASTFSVTTGGVPIAGTRALSAGERGPNTVVTFTPTAPWTASTAITVSITTGVQSAVGSALLAAQSAVFSTGTGADGTAPTVVAVNPAAGATGIFTNQVFTVQFNETLNPATVTAASVALTAGGTPVAVQRILTGTNNSAVVLVPDALLSPNTTYTFTATTTVTDQAGNALAAPFTSTFTTTTTADNFRPSVINVSPPNGTTGVAATAIITVTFSEPMNPGSVNSNTLSIDGPEGRVRGTYVLSANNTIATFTPTFPLFAGRSYTITARVGLQDLVGNALVNPQTTTFTTVLAPGTGALPTAATLTINPGSLFANGLIPTTAIISNITISGTPVANGTIIAVTASPAYVQTSAGGTISGPSIGSSPDGRFLLFSTLNASVTVSYTPPDLTALPPNQTASGVVQVASVDTDGWPVNLIGQGTTTLFAMQSATINASPTAIPANGSSTSALTVTVRDRNNALVPDGTRVGMTAASIFQSSVGGTIVGGTTSTGDPRVHIFTTAGGQFTASYQSSTSPGTATMQAVTVDALGRPTGLAGTTSITLQ